LRLFVAKNGISAYNVITMNKRGDSMNILFLFLIMFFGIFGAVKAVRIAYNCVIRGISKKENDVKIWMKSNQ
jgi:hypothetical protein